MKKKFVINSEAASFDVRQKRHSVCDYGCCGQIGLMLLSAMIAVLVVRCVKLFFPLIMPDSPNTVRTHSTCSDWLLSTHHQRKHLCRLSPFLGLNLTENYRLTFLNSVNSVCVIVIE